MVLWSRYGKAYKYKGFVISPFEFVKGHRQYRVRAGYFGDNDFESVAEAKRFINRIVG